MSESKDEKLVNSYEEVINEESKHLGLGNTVSGLALSGGGIRSASFGLGVMQALVAKNQLYKMDYMSTVSGGGYLGAALTWALNEGKGEAGTKSGNFPLGKKNSQGNKNKDNNKLLDFIRQHSSYLVPISSLDIVSFVAVIVRSMIISLFFYLSVLTIVMTICVWGVYAIAHDVLSYKHSTGLLLRCALVITGIMIILGFMFSFGTFIKKANSIRYSSFIKGQKFLGVMLKLLIASILLGTLPYVTEILGDGIQLLLAPGASTIFGSGVGAWQYLKARKNKKNNSGSSNTMIYAGAFALFYGIFLFAYIIAVKVFLNDQLSFKDNYWFILLIAFACVVGYFVNLNLIGPNYVWRNRLMETFMPDQEAVNANTWKEATKADNALMEDMCNAENPKPYHIINTNVILTNSKRVNYRGRGGDNFIISPLYCGSDATGWKETKSFQKNNGKGITLASAMAASAAALNPNAGVSGGGVTRNKVVSILLSLLNLRLGYWTINPSKKENLHVRSNFFVPGLSSEILRMGLNENNYDLLLSDGGHFENLAFYELIRRKLDLIVVSDGACDSGFNFDDLANAIEKVRVDFGAAINFKDNYMSDNILPGTSGESYFQKKYAISKKGFAVALIEYNDGKKGLLVYIKLAVIDRLSTDVYSYKGINPSFPHQSTSDQFFDEKQFEAYRELGYSICKQAMESNLGSKIFSSAPKFNIKDIIDDISFSTLS